MKRVFITGAGTEVGKTFVTRLLLRQLREKGIATSALKPVVTGYSPENAHESDTRNLLDAMSMPVNDETIGLISPWRFLAPLAPSMAARLEGRKIELPEVVEFCARAFADAESLLIEGVGGAMVPLNDAHTVRDWIKALDVPAILVTGSYLGSISHTLTALEALRAKAITVAAIVVSESENSSVQLDETIADIERFAAGVRVQALPRCFELGRAPDLTYLITESIGKNR